MDNKCVQKAIRHSAGLEQLMNAIVYFIHPAQFRASVLALERQPDMPKAETARQRVGQFLKTWPSIFGGMTWVLNRVTHAHRDRSGFDKTYDYLAVSGQASAQMFLRDLGLTIPYRRADVVALTGRFLTHEVGDWQGNDRVSSVRYIRADVFKDANIPEPGWADVQSVKAQLGIL
jgi:hypothetical protein